MEKVEKKSNSLKIKTEEIALLVSKTSKNCYGVVAIANKDDINLVEKISTIIKKGKKEEGVFVTKYSDNTFSVSVYLVLAQDIKITEALRECQKSIRFTLNKKYPGQCKAVNVYANELR